MLHAPDGNGATGALSSLLILALLLADTASDPGVRRHDDDTPTVEEARGFLKRQDWDGAAAALRAIVEAEPKNATAWSLLGYSLHAKGDWEAALSAHVRAASFDETRARSSYNAACVYARQGRPDDAFDWLEKAWEAGFTNLSLVKSDTDLDGLRGDERLARYLPRDPRSKEPFLEDVRIVHDHFGEAPNDQYGWVARNVGDPDGDGISDYAITAPFHDTDGPNGGSVHVHSGKTGERLFLWEGEAGENLGWAVAWAGDVNGDGRDDVIVGAPGGGPAKGRVYVYSGRDGERLLTLEGEGAGDLFGREIWGVGDADGDGAGDVLVGAPGNDGAGADAGRAYVYSGATGRELHRIDGDQPGDKYGSAVTGTSAGERAYVVVAAFDAGDTGGGRLTAYSATDWEPLFEVAGGPTSRELGFFLSIVGDVDGDGYRDVYATDWNDAAKGPATGRAFVYSGDSGELLLEFVGKGAGEGFGIGVGDAGDIDRDGHDDLVIGAWRNADAATLGGKIYFHSGADGALLGTITGAIEGDTLGFDATGMGDVDGDGSLDFLLTSAWNRASGAKAGRTYVVSGAFLCRDD